MAWFQKLCRRAGLATHHVAKAVREPAAAPPPPETREVSRTVEQHREGSVTLRRTTIEEVEIRHDRDA